MTIAQQSAMPTVASRPRRPYPLHLAPRATPGRTIAKLAALVVCTALTAALAAGIVGLAFVMLAAGAGH